MTPGGALTPMERLAEIQARVKAATPSPLSWGEQNPGVDPVEDYRAHLAFGEGPVYFVWAPKHPRTGGDPDACVAVAITGNGPTSAANADLIAHAPGDLTYLLESLSAVREEMAATQQQLDKAYESIEHQRKSLDRHRETRTQLEGEVSSLREQLKEAQQMIADVVAGVREAGDESLREAAKAVVEKLDALSPEQQVAGIGSRNFVSMWELETEVNNLRRALSPGAAQTTTEKP
jgi:hypothetical protein